MKCWRRLRGGGGGQKVAWVKLLSKNGLSFSFGRFTNTTNVTFGNNDDDVEEEDEDKKNHYLTGFHHWIMMGMTFDLDDTSQGGKITTINH